VDIGVVLCNASVYSTLLRPCFFRSLEWRALVSVIKFGTSGWRAIVADEFTLANIRLAVAGIAAYVKTQPRPIAC